MEKEVDYIIVGQGLAGSVLSFVLLKEGKTVHVIDSMQQNTSSRVAAGLYNPITGRKMVKTWNADKLFPLIEPFYAEMEEWGQARFLYPIGIFRPFLDNKELNEWQAKVSEPAFSAFVKNIYAGNRFEHTVNEFGGLDLQPSGYLDIPVLLKSVNGLLRSQKMFLEGQFHEGELKFLDNTVSYRGIKARKIVFCTGVNTTSFFDWLPLRPVKGEILEIEAPIKIETIINRGVFIVPKPKGRFKVGSTYNKDDLTTDVTERGIKYLKDKLGALLRTDYKIVQGVAGLRPATADRRPFIGFHPDKPEIGLLNGFGTKGVSLLPYYANQFYKHAEFGEELDKEVNISRYF